MDQQPFDMSDFGAMLQRLGAMMQRADGLPAGAVDWDAVLQTARAVVAQQGDPSVVDAERARVRAAADLAQVWLDGVLDLPAPSAQAEAWSRSEWLQATFDGWKALLGPIAQSMERGVAEAMAAQEVPAELGAMMEQMTRIARAMASMMAAQQVGQALGALAQDVWGPSDIGIPLTRDGAVALVTGNTRAFADAHELPLRDVETLLALREAAAQRLFHGAPWIGPRLRDAVAEYAAGVRVDHERLRAMLEGMDPSDPTAMQAMLAGSGMELPMTPGQESALARVELLIALIEGWVDHVTELAHGGRIGGSAAIREALMRRRAEGGPAERTFGQLLGIELRPRRLREARAFWAAQDPDERDGVWRHPDFLPSSFDED